tara:strand:- start:155 stop:733 length:579 start_codon:yes stop_codon:yes gene_type:complete
MEYKILMTTFKEKLEPKGHLEIIKVFPDNTREVVLDDHNIITVGMARTLAAMFAHDNSLDSFDNFAIPYFQLGTASSTMTSSVFQLSAPISNEQYNTTELTISAINVHGAGAQYAIALNPAYIMKSALNKVTYSLTLDEATANNIDIMEVGLLSKNPFIQDPAISFLCAYRSFAVIPKRSSYTLILNWTIEF